MDKNFKKMSSKINDKNKNRRTEIFSNKNLNNKLLKKEKNKIK